MYYHFIFDNDSSQSLIWMLFQNASTTTPTHTIECTRRPIQVKEKQQEEKQQMIRYEGFHSCSSSSSNMAEETNPPLRRMLKNRSKGKFSYAFKIPGKQCTFPQASKKHDEISLSVPGMQRSSLSPAPSSADIILDQPPSTGHPTFSPPKLQTSSPNHVKPTFIGNENQCSIATCLSGHAQDMTGKKI